MQGQRRGRDSKGARAAAGRRDKAARHPHSTHCGRLRLGWLLIGSRRCVAALGWRMRHQLARAARRQLAT